MALSMFFSIQTSQQTSQHQTPPCSVCMLSAVIVRARSTAVGASLPSELGLAPNTKKALARCMWVEPVQPCFAAQSFPTAALASARSGSSVGSMVAGAALCDSPTSRRYLAEPGGGCSACPRNQSFFLFEFFKIDLKQIPAVLHAAQAQGGLGRHVPQLKTRQRPRCSWSGPAPSPR